MSATTYRRAVLVTGDISRGLWIALVGFMAIIAVIFLAIGVAGALAGNLDGGAGDSMWENSAYATRYFPLALGVMLTTAYLPIAVANGVTRRSFGLGGAAVVLGIAAVMAVLEAAGYLVENGLYRLAGATPEFTTPHLFGSGTEFWVVVPEVWITVSANVAVGWLIGSAYYRWGWFGPTLALPLMLVPTLAVEALMSIGWAGALMIDTLSIDRRPLWLAVPVSLAIVAATLWGTAWFVRGMAIRSQRA